MHMKVILEAILLTTAVVVVASVNISIKKYEWTPVLGPTPVKGAKPLYGLSHFGTDAIFALACNYPIKYYQVMLMFKFKTKMK